MRFQTDFIPILNWLSNNGLEVVLLVLGAALMTISGLSCGWFSLLGRGADGLLVSRPTVALDVTAE